MGQIKTAVANVLGTNYTVLLGDRADIAIPNDYAGLTHVYLKTIKVNNRCEGTPIQDTEQEVSVRCVETIAHELFHAFVNESGIDVDSEVEEKFACFYQMNWRKMTNTIMQVCEELEVGDFLMI